MAQRQAPIPPSYLYPGCVTQVIDPHYFWMQLWSRETRFKFEQLQQELQAFGMKQWRNISDTDSLHPGQVVIVDTREMTGGIRWRRGQVAMVTSENSVDIFFLDYGNTELTSVDRVCGMFPAHFQELPPQAMRCSLAGVQPISKSWTSRGTKTFQKLVMDQSLQTLIMYMDQGYCEVSLYPGDTENGRSISHALLDEEVAMSVEQRDVPEYVTDIPAFMASLYQATDLSCENDCQETKGQVDEFESSKTSPLSAKTVEKYIPPGRKAASQESLSPKGNSYLASSPKGINYSKSPPSATTSSNSTMQSSPAANLQSQKKLTLNTNLKAKEPVVDFFPFENVSTYPPTPVSPAKSPGKSPGSSQPDFESPASGSQYFRSPVRNHQYTEQNSRSASKYDHQYQNSRYKSRYSTNQNSGSRHNHHERSRFAANFNNFPESSKSNMSYNSKQASSTFEPSYLNNSSNEKGESKARNGRSFPADRYQPEPRNLKHLSDSLGDAVSDRSGNSSRQVPFYPPKSTDEPSARELTLTPPNYYQSHAQDAPPKDLTPPGFYQAKKDSQAARTNQQQFDGATGTTMGNGSGRQSTIVGATVSGPRSVYNTDNQGYGGYGTATQPHTYPSHQYDKYYKENGTEAGTNGYPYTSPNGSLSPSKASTNNSNYNSSMQRPRLDIYRTPVKSQAMDHKKESPISPESPAIAGFNVEDLAHTQNLSKDYFHDRFHQENLQALMEEAEDIAKESKEQSELVKMARYGGLDDEEDDHHVDGLDIVGQVTEEVIYTNQHSTKEYDELRRSPIKRTISYEKDRHVRTKDTDLPQKLMGIPPAYIVDINFCEAIQEALEFGKTDGMENTKALLDGIVESLKLANVEKQLYDVLLMLLAWAIQDYNTYHLLIMDTISALNNEMEIKECLARALKRQEEICVRFPVKTSAHHLNFSRVMGKVYNMAFSWIDSNASIQDGILATVEKWIVFNNKGSQMGQVEKENVFLDCFGAFWEVCGSQLLRHNRSFRSRIQTEIRKKLLNEDVSRTIRERLLDILMELFSVSVETHDAGTQTIRRTMIPSSCQVKPFTGDKATMTPMDWQNDDVYLYDVLDSSWASPVSEQNSTEQAVSLRPQGHQPPGLKLSLSPQENHSSPCYNSPCVLTGTPVANSFSGNISNVSANNDSVYLTPNESFISDNNEDSRLGKEEKNGNHTPKRKTGSQSKIGSQTGPVSCSLGTGETDSSCDQDRDKDFQTGAGRSKTVKSAASVIGMEKKSASGKSIVDWFDYEPESVEVSNKSEATLQEKRLEARKQVEQSIDIAEMYTIEGKGPKSKQKKNKKTKKSSQMQGKQDSVVETRHDDFVEKGGSGFGEKPCVESVVDDKPVDWWGVGEEAESRTSNMVVRNCDIYADTGPDVIIEGEFEQLVDYDGSVADLLQSPDGTDDIWNKAAVMGSGSVSQDSVSKDCEREINHKNKDNDEYSMKNVSKGIDGFAFEVDDEIDEWDSDDSDEYDGNFPVTDLCDKVRPVTNVTEATKANLSSDFDRNFPATNLSEYIRQPEQEVVELPADKRWVPGKRKCLTCHDPGHTTNNCPRGVIFHH